MTGNVWEWCNDCHDRNYYANSPQENPKGPSSSGCRVVRGGSWCYGDRNCRVSYRRIGIPDCRYFSFGFRLALQV